MAAGWFQTDELAPALAPSVGRLQVSSPARLRRRSAAAIVVALAWASLVACSDDTPSAPAYEVVDLPNDPEAVARVVAVDHSRDEFWAVGSTTDADGNRHAAAWRSADAHAWTPVPIAPVSFYGERAELYSVAAGPAGVVAVGAASGGAHGNPRTATWVLDGEVMREVAAPFELYGGPRAISVRAVTDGPAGFVIVGTRRAANDRTGAVVWVSADGHAFTLVDDDPSLSSAADELGRALAVAGGSDGYLAAGDVLYRGLGSLDTAGVIWTSSDGRRWARSAQGDDFGVGGSVSVTAVAGSVAGGVVTEEGRSEAVVWRLSADGGWEATRVPEWDDTPAVTGLAADGGTVLAAGRRGDEPVLAVGAGEDWRALPGPPGAPSGRHVQVAVALAGGVAAVAVFDATSAALWRLVLP
ncbi:MAG: hypothetical protein ACRDWI_08420 [Jiangellaceae bacterium]